MGQLWGWQDRIPAGEGQGSEGGGDQYENCVYAAHALDMILLGYGDPFEPQQWRDGGVDPGTKGTHGGQSFQAAIDFIKAHPEAFANPPTMTVEGPGDIVAAIGSYGHQGFPMVVAVYCNAQAVINTSGPFEHAAVPIAQDDGGILLWADGFFGGTKYLPNAMMRAAYAGGLTVFHRDCRPQTAPVQPPKPVEPPKPPPPEDNQNMQNATVLKWPDGRQEKFRLNGNAELQHTYEKDTTSHQWSTWANVCTDGSLSGIASIDGIIWVKNDAGQDVPEIHCTTEGGDSVHGRYMSDGWHGWPIGL